MMNRLIVIFSILVLHCYSDEFPEFHGYEDHDESIHDEDSHDQEGGAFGPFTDADMVGHFKDIIRGFSDKGVEESDRNGDGFLDETEIETFITEKMGYTIKTTPSYVIHHYDLDEDKLLSKDEVWRIVENKDPAIFKILPEVMEKNMLLMHGMQSEHFNDDPIVNDDGNVIRY